MPGLDLLPEFEPEKYYQPKKWGIKHRQCVALHLAGWTNNEIAEALDWTPAKVSITINDPRAHHDSENVLAPVADVARSVSQKLEEASSDAFEVAMEILHQGEKDETRLKAAFGLLDRAGYTPIKRELKLEGEIPADPELVEQMRKTLLESKSISAKYVVKPAVQDAEYEIMDQAVNE